MSDDRLNKYREFLKDNIRQAVDFYNTDQHKGIKPPALEKEYTGDKEVIKLPRQYEWKNVREMTLKSAIKNRKSHRRYKDEPLKLDELSFLLWGTQGLNSMVNPGLATRVVPSAGCRHAFETYLCILNVEGLEEGVYRYLPIEHGLIYEHTESKLSQKLTTATLDQAFTGKAPVTFIWTTIPYRMEWRYDIAAHKVIALDAGHVCQNLYLAVQAIGAGTCAIAAYDQQKMDELLKVDGNDEFVIYLAPVGKIS